MTQGKPGVDRKQPCRVRLLGESLTALTANLLKMMRIAAQTNEDSKKQHSFIEYRNFSANNDDRG